MTGYDIFKTLFIDFKVVSIPLLSIVLTITVKAISLPCEIDVVKLKELLHFGTGLSVSGLMMLASTICFQAQQPLNTNANDVIASVYIQLYMTIIHMVLVVMHALTIRRFGCDKNSGAMKTRWLIISNIIGMTLLLLAIWFIR